MNKVILIGNLTRDPELRTTTSGISVATFSVAVNRPFASASGEREVDFLSCVVWRKQAENLVKYCGKGSSVAVEGRIQTRSYEAQDGSKRYVTEVVCDNVQFLQTRKSEQSSNNFANNNSFNKPAGENNFSNRPALNEDPFANMQDPFANNGDIDLTDDDLPF